MSVGQAGAFLKCYEMLNPWSMHVQESFDYILCSDDDIYPCDTADRLPIFSDYHASTPRPLVFTTVLSVALLTVALLSSAPCSEPAGLLCAIPSLFTVAHLRTSPALTSLLWVVCRSARRAEGGLLRRVFRRPPRPLLRRDMPG